MVWYSHLLKNFPHAKVKGFSVVNRAEVDVILNSLAFWMIQRINVYLNVQ